MNYNITFKSAGFCFLGILFICLASCGDTHENGKEKPKNEPFFFLSFKYGMDSSTFSKVVDSLENTGGLRQKRIIGTCFPLKIADSILFLPILPKYEDGKLVSMTIIWRSKERHYVDEITSSYKLRYGDPKFITSEECIYAMLNGSYPLIVWKGNLEAEQSLRMSKDKLITDKNFDAIMTWHDPEKTINLRKRKHEKYWEHVYQSELLGSLSQPKKDENGRFVWKKVNEVYFEVEIEYLSKEYSEKIEREKAAKKEIDLKEKEKEKKLNDEVKNEI